MASVVQVGTAVGFNNTSTAAVSLTGVTAGSSILIYCALYSDATPADPSATGYTLARRGSITNGSSSRSASFLYAHNVASGTHNITVNTSAASGFQFGFAIPFEVSGLVNAAPNVTMPAANGANGANDAAPTTGTSGATTVANTFIVAGMCLAANTADAGIDVPATTGYTNHGVRQISTSETAYAFDSKSVTSTGTQSAAWGTLLASAEWAAVLVAFEANATATVNITGVSTSTPVQGSSLTITCTGAGATQGTRDVRIGGVIQTPTSWSDTSITVTVDRGTNKFGAALNVEVFNSGSLDSNSFALTSLQPVSGWDFIDIVSPAANLSTRLTTRPDLVAGDQISWNTRGGLVDVFSDGTWSADPSVLSFPFEAWNTGSGWGQQRDQVLYSAQVLDGRSDAEIRLRAVRQRRATRKLLDVRTWGGSSLDPRKWFADELEAGAGGANVYDVSLTEAATAADSLSAAMQQAAALAEAATAADAYAAQAAFVRALAEAASAGDVQAAVLLALAALTEPATAAEALASSLLLGAGALEAAAAADSVAAGLLAGAAVTETAAAADAQSTGPVLTGAVSESVTLADALAAVAALLASMVEAAAAAESAAAQMTRTGAVSEAAAAADAQTTGPQVSASLAETVAAAEALATAMNLVAQIAEAGTAAEVLNTAAALGALLTEPAVPVDSIAATAAATYSASVAETVSALEAIVALLVSGAFNPSAPPQLRREAAARLANIQAATRGRNTNRGTR